MFKPALQMNLPEVVQEVKVVEVVVVRVEVVAEIETKVEVVIYLITKTLYAIVARRKDI